MTSAWTTVVALCLTLAVTKGIGPVALGDRALPLPLMKVIDLLAPAILAALIAVGTFTGSGGDLVIDARAGGLAVAAAVYAVSRKSILLAAGTAAVTAALIRALA